jgi:hypothetical protein
MNIFYLDPDPITCAQQHVDKHVVKMIIEYAQLMSTAHRVLDGEEWMGRSITGRGVKRWFHPDASMNEHLYKACHVNHPSAKWVRESMANYNWLYELWINLCEEYTYRYDKEHLTRTKLEYFLLLPPMNISEKPFTQPTPAMAQYPHCIVEGDSVTSYRQFYWEDKYSFAKWTKRDVPKWWKKYEWERKQAETFGGGSENVL